MGIGYNLAQRRASWQYDLMSGDRPKTEQHTDSTVSDDHDGEHPGAVGQDKTHNQPEGAATGGRASQSSMPEKKPLNENKPEKEALTVEQLAKLGAAVLVLCYGVGLLVVNSFLLHYGASDFNLFRARFIFTGLLVLTVVGISTACPVTFFYCSRAWLRTPKWFQKKYEIDDSVTAWLFLLFSLVMLAIPYLILRFVLGQGNFGSLQAYVLCGVTGGIVLFAWYGTVSRPEGTKRKGGAKAESRRRNKLQKSGTKPKKLSKLGETMPPFWIFYSSLGVIFLPYVFLTVIYVSQHLFPSIPTQLGGARVQQVQLSIASDAVAELRTLGLPFLNKTSEVTKHISLLFAGENFYLVQSGDDTFVLSDADVNGVKPLNYP